MDQNSFYESQDNNEEDLPEQVVPDMKPSTSRGTKRKNFDQLQSSKHRRRRLDELDKSVEEAKGSLISILHLAVRRSNQEKKSEGVKMLKEYIKACERGQDFPTKNSQKPKELETDLAVGLMAYNNLSRNQYHNVQQVVKRECLNILPPAKKVLIAKKSCYPENLTVTDTKAVVPVKDLTSHTTKRIIDAYKEEIYENIKKLPSSSSSSNPKIIRAEMICCWGMDGTTAQSLYNQGTTAKNQQVNDNSLITVSMTSHQLRFHDESNCIPLWDNIKSQSVYSVRPIQVEFTKETPTTILDIYEDIKAQTEKLGSERFICEDLVLEITYDFFPTMTGRRESLPIHHENFSSFSLSVLWSHTD